MHVNYRPNQEYFTHLGSSALLMKGWKLWTLFGAERGFYCAILTMSRVTYMFDSVYPQDRPFSRLVRQVMDILTKYLLEEDGILQLKQIQRRPYTCEYNMWYTGIRTINDSEQGFKKKFRFSITRVYTIQTLGPSLKKNVKMKL